MLHFYYHCFDSDGLKDYSGAVTADIELKTFVSDMERIKFNGLAVQIATYNAESLQKAIDLLMILKTRFR